MSRYYYTEDAPHLVATGSPSRSPIWYGSVRVAGLEFATFVFGVYKTADPNEIASLDVWNSQGKGCTKAKWLQVWGQKAPAAVVADVQANGN